ncbi:MAG: SLC13 family permease [Solirubrobacteraceae bacterium]
MSSGVHDTVDLLAPTLGFLMAALVIADACARLGVFEALGAGIAHGAAGRPRRLYLRVLVAAALTTVALSLDATVVLLLPVVLVAAERSRVAARIHAYVVGHLANSASLLLPFSNLTNLIVVAAAGLGALRFAERMALPTLVAVLIDAVALAVVFRRDLRGVDAAPLGSPVDDTPATDPLAPRTVAALGLVALTLVGFVAASELGVAVVWAALPGAALLALLARMRPAAVVHAAQPAFAASVLVLGFAIAGVRSLGLDGVVTSLVPTGHSLGALLGMTVLAALAAGLVNNLPATLLLLPAALHGGEPTLLALLIGVNVGPNLLPTGSLATILWWRVARDAGHPPAVRDVARSGIATVPVTLVLATVALWAVT